MRKNTALLLLAVTPLEACAKVDFEGCLARLPGTWEAEGRGRGALRLGPNGEASAWNLRLGNVDESMLSIEGEGRWSRPVEGANDAKQFGSTASFRVDLKDDHGNPTSVSLYLDCAGSEPTVVDWAGNPQTRRSRTFRRRR